MDYVITTKMYNGKTKEEEKKEVILSELRPPHVWNHLVQENKYVSFEEKIQKRAEKKLKKKGVEDPLKVLEPQIQFRDYVNPTSCYIDERIQNILRKCDNLGVHLRMN
jgi:hypothetical protein